MFRVGWNHMGEGLSNLAEKRSLDYMYFQKLKWNDVITYMQAY